MGTLLLVVLILLLVGALPTYPYSRNWGYAPSGVLGFVLVLILILILLGHVPLWYGPPAGPPVIVR